MSYTRITRGYSGSTLTTFEERYGEKDPLKKAVMPFTGRYYYTTPRSGRIKLDANNTSTARALFSAAASRATGVAEQRAWRRFRDSVMETASLGTSIAEARESADMINKRAKQLADSYETLHNRRTRRPDLAGLLRMCRKLKVRPRVRHTQRDYWSIPKDASAIWLEYWLGWAPLIGDIYQAIEILNRDFGGGIAIGRATVGYHDTFVEGVPTSGVYYNFRNEGISRVEYAANFHVTNPNLLLMEQLGLINPAAVAWDLVPFSFIVNWFVPVGDYLRSYSFGAGIQLSNGRTSWTRRVIGSDLALYEGVHYDCENRCIFFGRLPSLKEPTALYFDVPLRLAFTRAATAISLLISIFRKTG